MSFEGKHVDLTNCDREPIHIPGSIQPHGAMVVTDPATYRVQYVSANIEDVIKLAPQDAIGLELAQVIGVRSEHDVINAAARAGSCTIAGVVLRAPMDGKGIDADITIHRYLNRLLIEFERSASSEDGDVALHLTQMLVRRVDKETELAPLVQSVAVLVRAMLGYDRVMIHRFLHNGAGRVIAEAKSRIRKGLNKHNILRAVW